MPDAAGGFQVTGQLDSVYFLVSKILGPQLGDGIEPVLLRRSFRAASGMPEFSGEIRNLVMSKGGDAMPGQNSLCLPISSLGVLRSLS